MTAPRVEWHAPYGASCGTDATDLAAECGIHLDGWQARVLEHGLAERRDGKWQHRSVGVCVPRQNGKGVIITARELAGLFLLEEELILHTAHNFKTAKDGMRRLEQALKASPEMAGRIHRVSRSHGEEVIELDSGQRVMFTTRTERTGRGLSCDCLILDEAMYLSGDHMAALAPTMSARPNPQAWYLGSAVDRVRHGGRVFAGLRRNAMGGGHDNIAWSEWSLDYPGPGDVPDGVASDPVSWAATNPAFGLDGRIGEDDVRGELSGGLLRREFAVERLGVGDWPSEDAAENGVIPWNVWQALTATDSVLPDPVVLGVDVSPDLRWATVSAAGVLPDGAVHVEVWAHEPGVRWLPERLAAVTGRHDVSHVVCDGKGQAEAIVSALDVDADVVVTDYKQMVDACARFARLVVEGDLRHLGDDILGEAVRGATTRDLGGAWAWNRRSGACITPLVAATLAAWQALESRTASVYESRELLTLG